MTNVRDKIYRENQSTHFVSIHFFWKSCCYEIITRTSKEREARDMITTKSSEVELMLLHHVLKQLRIFFFV